MEPNQLIEKIHDWLTRLGLSENAGDWVGHLIVLAGILLIAFAVTWLGRRTIPLIQRLSKRTSVTWDDALFSAPLLRRLLRIVPWIVISTMLPLAFGQHPETLKILGRICTIAIVWHLVAYLSALIKAIFMLVEQRQNAQGRPMRGVEQVLQLLLFIVAAIVIICIIIQKSPTTLLAGLGASAALLMLIFKDSIVGIVSGVQLSANDMLKPGDWITMPKYGADGTVIEVTMGTVKVQNFDNTITTIPPYALTSDSFQNWRGMELSPGRRIKRSVNIEMNSVKFCTPEMLEKYRKIALLTNYIDEKEAELAKWNADHQLDESVAINARRQTNLGVLRAYLLRYLQSLPKVNQQMTCMVRQLQPTETGIPLELYCFSLLKDTPGYEQLQSDIFDHVLSVVPEFDLYVFQSPSGRDMQASGRGSAEHGTRNTENGTDARSRSRGRLRTMPCKEEEDERSSSTRDTKLKPL